MDLGMVVGAQQTPAIANALQQQVEPVVEEASPRDDRLSLKTYGVFYHSQLAQGARHVWMAHALSEEVQELVSQALEGEKLSMAEASVYKAAEELQRLQKRMVVTSKETMRRALESESDSKSRRAAGRLLFTQKRGGVYQKADMELLAARGLKDWETSDEELREARKQARTEAKKEFLKAAEEAPKTPKAFVEGIDDVEHAKWTPEQKRTVCHKAVELRNELRKEFGTYYMEDEAPPGPTCIRDTTTPMYGEEALDCLRSLGG
jgi:hypothetical protein